MFLKDNFSSFFAGFRYFLNIDTCAYGSFRHNLRWHRTKAEGPLVFAVDRNCQNIFEYNSIKQTWLNLTRHRESNENGSQAQVKSLQCSKNSESASRILSKRP